MTIIRPRSAVMHVFDEEDRGKYTKGAKTSTSKSMRIVGVAVVVFCVLGV